MSPIYGANPSFPQPDRDAVEAFVDCLFRYASEDAFINLRAFHDLRDGAPPLFVEPVKFGAADFIERVCKRIHEAAAHPEPHVFCPPLCAFTEPNGAANENLAEGVALSVECDSNPHAARKKLAGILGEPTAVVASGGNWKNPQTGRLEAKLHLHWRLAEPTRDPADHARLYEARALAAEIVGADKTAVALVHPLRWAGSWHRKTDIPRLARLEARPESEIELGQALERLREAHAASAAPGKGNGHDHDEEGRELTAPLGELKAAMAVIPNTNLDWNAWNRIGMALWVASSGQGLDAFDAWSRKSSKYDAETTKARWEHYGSSPPQRIGAGTIFHLANEADADWRNRHAATQKAAKSKAESEEEALLNALARKSKIEYDRERKQAAKKLNIRPGTLDDVIKQLRDEVAAEKLLCPWWDVEPWHNAVETAALLTELQPQIRRYAVITEEQSLTSALWSMMAWVHSRAATHSPILMVSSPQPNSGKSTLLGVLGFLTPRSLVCVGLNEAVLFRSIDLWQPTLITDEADTAFIDNEPLRAVYNSGWARGTGVPRCVGDSHTPKMFETFCPRALGLKGKNLPDTTASRCITIEMKRKLPDETAADFSHMDDKAFATLRRKLARWADDNWETLARAQPQTPVGFHNRVRRNWWLLSAIAELAGPDWAEKTRRAASSIEGLREVGDIEIELLADTKGVFDAENAAEISTKSLIAKLCEDEERPWATFSKGKQITDRQIARMLRKYGIPSEDVYPNGIHAKGYKLARFQEAWARYLTQPKNTPPA
jgi:Protein of unknown function (DUF3631)/Primase C terminal 2 (PriCT-2)